MSSFIKVLIFSFAGDCTEETRPRCPISMDLASHIESRGHTHFVPIAGGCGVRLKNVTFSPDHHKVVRKKWKRMVKDGDITSVSYDMPRPCGKCNALMSDAIDMFKHIKENHI